jgi:hypothetical protein
MDYKFNNYTVADKLNTIIDHSIGYKAKQSNSVKYFRATVDKIQGNLADVYLQATVAATPIKNVKIASGIRHLMAGEGVYLLALNGNLNNCIIDKRIIDYNLLLEDDVENCYIIENFDGNYERYWSGGSNAYFLTTTDRYRIGLKAQITGYLSLETAYAFTYEPNDTINLTLFPDGSPSITSDYISLSFYIEDLTRVSNLKLRIGNTSSNYFEYIISGLGLTSGWNTINTKKSSFTKVGSFSGWENILYLGILVNYSVTALDIDYVIFGLLAMYKQYSSGINLDTQSALDDIAVTIDTKQNTSDYLSDITLLSGSGILARSTTPEQIYLTSISGTSQEITVTNTIANGGTITLSLPSTVAITTLSTSNINNFINLSGYHANFGVTHPSNWEATDALIGIGGCSAIYTSIVESASNSLSFSNNNYHYMGENYYKYSGKATIYTQQSSNHLFGYGALGVANDPITFISSFTIAEDKIRIGTGALKTWNTSLNVIEIGDFASLSVEKVMTNNTLKIMNNLYLDTNSVYQYSNPSWQASAYLQYGYNHEFYSLHGTITDINDFLSFKIEHEKVTSNVNLIIRKATPSSWNTTVHKVVELGDTASIFASTETYKNIKISQNICADGANSYYYIESGYATLYEQKHGEHNFYIAPSGSADGAITTNLSMKLDNSGNLNIYHNLEITGTLTVDTSSSLGLVQISSGTPPSTITSTGTQGQIRFDSGYIYIATGTNTWRRAELSTW